METTLFFALTPNDRRMADTFYQIMKSGNIETTRTHTTPYNELWITAADENGIGISHEGTWPLADDSVFYARPEFDRYVGRRIYRYVEKNIVIIRLFSSGLSIMR